MYTNNSSSTSQASHSKARPIMPATTSRTTRGEKGKQNFAISLSAQTNSASHVTLALFFFFYFLKYFFSLMFFFFFYLYECLPCVRDCLKVSELLIEPDISLLTLETLLFVRSTELLCSLGTGLPSAPESESEKKNKKKTVV